MDDLKIIIETKSCAFPGSGEGYGSVVDRDVVFDDWGLPYLPARRIKGVLRESALEVKEMLEQSDSTANVLDTSMSDVFGEEGQREGSRLIISDFYLQEHSAFQDWIKWLCFEYKALFSPAVVMDYFTQIRQQTSIDPNGLAEEGSLRRSRVLKKGLFFEGKVTLLEGDLKEINLLALACANMRRFGGQRNRGFGEVRVTLFEGEKNCSDEALALLEGGN